MDTNIERLIETISDSIEKTDEKIASLETDLEIYKNRIKELEKVNKELTESDDERVKAAYKDGYGTAVAKMSACLQEMRAVLQ